MRVLKFLCLLPSILLAMLPGSQWQQYYLQGSAEPTSIGDYLHNKEQERTTRRNQMYRMGYDLRPRPRDSFFD